LLVRFGRGPKDKRETPDVLSRGMCFPTPPVDWLGVSSAKEEAVEPAPRFRLLRMVTVEGTTDMTDERGDARGGVKTGAGSLERTL
jgi:hypothetical protein